jgi:hypothetical protein
MKELVKSYFATVAAMRAGEKQAVTKMMALWNPDGVLEVLGGRGDDGWPRSKVYKGTKEIQARFEAMLQASPILLSGAKGKVGFDVRVMVGDISEKGNTASALVTATVSAGKAGLQSFQIEEKKFVFTFAKDRIQKAVEDVSWSDAVVSNRVTATGALSVQDIGRLTLAAWAIA